MCQIRIVWLLVCYTWLLLSVGVTVSADDVDYLRDVKPVLRERCFACHGSLKQEAELRLDTVDAMRHGSYSGSVLDANNVDASMLWQRITATDEERMPPEGAALSAEEIQAIRTWMIQGAVGPIDEQPEADPTQHWAFLPPVASPIPNTKASATNPIDAFLNDKLVSAGIAPNPAADPSLQLRRLSIDLIGLVPNQSEQQAFLAAYTESPEQAYADAVQQLLHRPEHGQRWARHWMDIWRYSDWYGLGEQVRFSQKHIWRWRSWIVESLNQNVGYDQMILQMLAADEIWPTDESKLRATGFLVRNYYLFNRTTWLDNTIEHTSKALMGLTMNCCKCHDHKYDPLSHEDYYRMRAIFEPHQVRIDLVESQTNLDVDGLVRTFDAHPDEPTYVHLRGNEKDLDTSRVVPPGVPAVVADLPYSPEEITLPPAAFAPQIRPDVLAAYEAESQGRIDAATKTLEAFSETEEASAITAAERVVAERELAAAQCHLEKVRTAHAADVAKILNAPDLAACRKNAMLAKRQATLADTRLALAKLELASLSDHQEKRPSTEQLENAQKQVGQAAEQLGSLDGDYDSLSGSVKSAEGPDESNASRFAPYPQVSTGRRTAFAQWLIHPEHPLTARVAVNHIWCRHFGQPLVDPVEDFGLRTKPPVQQALLDWLAVELVQRNWDMKWLHHLIVSSDAYRRSSVVQDQAADIDSQNQFYWRRNVIRMEAEVLRDSILYLAGELDTSCGGPTIDPLKQEHSLRRSLYFTQSENDKHEFLSTFDAADVLRCYRRTVSILPQQALALSNSEFALSMAPKIANQICVDGGLVSDTQAESQTIDWNAFVEVAWQTLLSRAIQQDERQACLQAVADWQTELSGLAEPERDRRIRANLVHAILNVNDFITIR